MDLAHMAPYEVRKLIRDKKNNGSDIGNVPRLCSGQSRNTAEGARIRLSSVYAEKSEALPHT